MFCNTDGIWRRNPFIHMPGRLLTINVCLHAAVLACLIPAGLCLFISACSGKDDVAVIRKIIQKGVILAQDKHINDLMDLTAEGFTAMPGRHDSRAVKGILFAAFRHYGQFITPNRR